VGAVLSKGTHQEFCNIIGENTICDQPISGPKF